MISVTSKFLLLLLVQAVLKKQFKSAFYFQHFSAVLKTSLGLA